MTKQKKPSWKFTTDTSPPDASSFLEALGAARPVDPPRGPVLICSPGADQRAEPETDPAPSDDVPPKPAPPPKVLYRGIPSDGLQPSEATGTHRSVVSIHSPLWVAIDAQLEAIATDDSDAAVTDAAQSPVRTSRTKLAEPNIEPGLKRLAALRLQCGGPSEFPGLADIAGMPNSSDPAVGEQAANDAVTALAGEWHQQTLTANEQLAAWLEATTDNVLEGLAAPVCALLGSFHTDANAHRSISTALGDTATTGWSDTGTGRAVAPSGSPFQTWTPADVIRLFRRVQRGLASGQLTVPSWIIGTRWHGDSAAHGDRIALAAATELVLWESLQGDDPTPNAVACQPVRAADLLRLRAADHIGPLAMLGDGRAMLSHRRAGLTVLFGPPGSGKTSTLNLIAASHPGPVVATTSKVHDWSGSFVPTRVARGPLWVFDPGNALSSLPDGAELVRWDAVQTCTDYESARRCAHVLSEASPTGGVENGNFWNRMAELMLAPLLLAANRMGRTIGVVAEWINTSNLQDAFSLKEPLRVLETHGDEAACQSLKRIIDLEARTRDSVAATVMQLMAPFSTGSAARLAVGGEPFDPDRDLMSTNGTVLLCLDSVLTRQLACLVTMFLDWVVRNRVERSDEGYTGPPLLIAGDEIANIAPIASLPQLLSEGPGRGIQGVLCLQDASQAMARWGAEGELFLTSSGHRVLFPGVSKPELLAWVNPLLSGSSDRPIGFGRPLGSPVAYPGGGPINVSEVARPPDKTVTVVTPAAEVIRARQARAQDDPWYRVAVIEGACFDMACQLVPEP